MPETIAAFVGAIPVNYDRHLGPILFHHYADDLVARLPARRGLRVLETACGTGIVTRRLADRLGADGRLVATDLNQAMIDHARGQVTSPAPVEWQATDATRLPFPDRSFDAVVCQFGIMFFPDKSAGLREALRVLEPGGVHLFNVWDAIEHNDVTRIAHETIASFFPDDSPRFYTVPFGFHDRDVIQSMLAGAGFERIQHETVEKVGTSPSAADAATGLIEGNPVMGEIMSRRPDALSDIKAALTRNIATRLGDEPVRCSLRAVVWAAHRPGG